MRPVARVGLPAGVGLALAAVLAVALPLLGQHEHHQASEPPRNLVLVSIDTLRADHLSFHGYRRETAPGIAALARQGTVFEQAFACASVTLPSHFTMFTGLHPRTHGVLENAGKGSGELVTLAEVLSKAGYSTGAFVASSILSAASGLGQGFDLYNDDVTSYFQRGPFRDVQVVPDWRLARPFGPGIEVPAQDVVDRALHWLDTQAQSPFFLFVHLYDPHNSYLPPPGFRRTFVTPGGDELQRLRDLYDCEIHYADAQLQRLWRALREKGLFDDTIIVVTGDHGEGLGEHDYLLHVMRVFDEELHVPLVFHGPGIPKKRLKAVVDLADLMPTLLQLLAIRGPRTEGGNLSPLIDRDDAQPARPFAYGERFHSRYPVTSYLLDGTKAEAPLSLRFLRSKEFKLLYPDTGPPLLFDLRVDPDEMRDLAAEKPDVLRRYLALSERPLENALPAVAPGRRVLTPEERERLGAVGYLAP